MRASRLLLPLALAVAPAAPSAAPRAQASPVLPADDLPRDLFPARVPLGLPAAIPAPTDDPLTPPVFALGRRLFFDPILSIDRSVACASCHLPAHGFAHPEPRPPGVHGRHAARHAPSLYNRGFGTLQRWDGRARSLEEQVLLPIEDANEMALPLADATARLRSDESYRTSFAALWSDGVTEANLARALASFVRGLVLADSPVDRFQAAQAAALTAAERAGLWIYESKGGCWQCHSGPNLSDEGFHNTGVGVVDGVPEDGRFAVTHDEADRGKFKTPTLRGVGETAPYMHDGSLATLEEVVDFYRRGGHPNEQLDRKMRALELTEADRDHLVAFLRALSRRGP